MSIFNIVSLLGGLAMFLYGMRLMGDSLRESSSGTFKKVMGTLTDNPVKAFLLGLAVTAVIQSSTATIVITSGLVGAGILSLHQSLGIIIGANVGTTVTGQIIRLLDVDDSAVSWLQFFRPSFLAPVALIIGIVLIMGFSFRNSKAAGNIAIGFGILFSGLLNMTGAVDVLSENGAFDALFSQLGANPLLGYLTGAGVAFVLQSSSATIGILQAFSMSGLLSFKAIYAVIVGIYLGDCVTTAIVCSIGAKAEAKRVGMVNILFNLSETVVVLAGVTLLYRIGLLGWIWNETVSPGIIANTNTIFNLACSILLFPLLGTYEKLSRKIVKDDAAPKSRYADKLEALSPNFFPMPALALNSCYEALCTMLDASCRNITAAFAIVRSYDEVLREGIEDEESEIDRLADSVSNYLIALSPHIKAEPQVRILDEYYKVVTEFERLGDHAENIAEAADTLLRQGVEFSDVALHELGIIKDLIDRILAHAKEAFEGRSVEAARHIEPLEEVVDDLVNALKEFHVGRLRDRECNVYAGTCFLNMLTDIERIADVCSNIGIEVITRANPELENKAHDYITALHKGSDEAYNAEYNAAHDEYFGRLAEGPRA